MTKSQGRRPSWAAPFPCSLPSSPACPYWPGVARRRPWALVGRPGRSAAACGAWRRGIDFGIPGWPAHRVEATGAWQEEQRWAHCSGPSWNPARPARHLLLLKAVWQGLFCLGPTMDRGATVENPYASVTIPRAQLQDSFLRHYLGGDLSPDTVLFNPSALPTCSAAQEKEREAAQAVTCAATWDSRKIQTQATWARPFNPYASLKMPNGEEPVHWKSHQVAAAEDARQEGCCSGICCRKCCPCCRQCCCIIS